MIAGKLAKQDPYDPFQEIQRQNQEVLSALDRGSRLRGIVGLIGRMRRAGDDGSGETDEQRPAQAMTKAAHFA